MTVKKPLTAQIAVTIDGVTYSGPELGGIDRRDDPQRREELRRRNRAFRDEFERASRPLVDQLALIESLRPLVFDAATKKRIPPPPDPVLDGQAAKVRELIDQLSRRLLLGHGLAAEVEGELGAP